MLHLLKLLEHCINVIKTETATSVNKIFGLVPFQIYTDWANHYLEKARSKKRVNSLATDCSDGVLLSEVIESASEYLKSS